MQFPRDQEHFKDIGSDGKHKTPFDDMEQSFEMICDKGRKF